VRWLDERCRPHWVGTAPARVSGPLFPVITLTAGAPLGPLLAGQLFGQGVEPQLILQVSAAVLLASLLPYMLVNAREARRAAPRGTPLAAGGGFGLVLRSGYLRLIALLITSPATVTRRWSY